MNGRLKKDELVKALVVAREAADALRETEDGGTCNLDTAAFRLAGMRREMVRDAAAAAGVSVSFSEWFGSMTVFLLHTSGQGNRRNRMAEAATRALAAAGLDACTYYQMD